MSYKDDSEPSGAYGANDSGRSSSGRRGGDDSYGSSDRTVDLTGDNSYGSSDRGNNSYGSSRRTGDDAGGDPDSYGSSDRTQATGFGSGTASGAGYGNKSSSHAEQKLGDFQASEGLGDSTKGYTGGHDNYGSGSTGGAGFGNKSSGYGDDVGEYHGSEGMGEHSKPYSGGHESYGSGSTGGAGYGNKSSSYGADDDSSKKDSTAGKLMEKVGGLFKNENMERRGAEKRSQAGRAEDESQY